MKFLIPNLGAEKLSRARESADKTICRARESADMSICRARESADKSIYRVRESADKSICRVRESARLVSLPTSLSAGQESLQKSEFAG